MSCPLLRSSQTGIIRRPIRLAPCRVVGCASAIREVVMAKGQMKGNKEAKKPKGDKPKSGGSAYKLSQGAPGGPATNPFSKKK